MKQSQKAFFEKYQKEIEEAEREEVYQDAKNPFPENSFVAPMKSEPIRPGARGSPTKESISPERADDGAGLPRPRPTTPVRPSNLGSVPTSLEKIFSGTSDERNVHEVLGVLVEAHIREAESILGRTFLKSEEVRIVANSLQLARYGIGAEGMNTPNPWISEWVLTYLRALPSVDGKSRGQFVEAWQNAQERLRHEQDAREKRQNAGGV